MNLSELKSYEGSKGFRKRVGRGESSGYGKSAGRGDKGQQSRSGGSIRPGFEGGQMPLYRKLPKLKGFKSKRAPRYEIVKLGQLDGLKEKTIDLDVLKKHGLISEKAAKIKVLASGEISNGVKVKAHFFSEQAAKQIEKAGGTVEVLNG